MGGITRAVTSAMGYWSDLESDVDDDSDDNEVSEYCKTHADGLESSLKKLEHATLFPEAAAFEAVIQARKVALAGGDVFAIDATTMLPVATCVEHILSRAMLETGFERVLPAECVAALRFASHIDFGSGGPASVLAVEPGYARVHLVKLGLAQGFCKQARSLAEKVVAVTKFANPYSGVGELRMYPSVFADGVTAQQLAEGFKRAAHILLAWKDAI